MFRNLMRLQIDLTPKDHKLLLKTLSIRTQEVILPKMQLQPIVIKIILRPSSLVSSITDMALLVAVAAMCIQFVVSIETLPAEATFRMALETRLVYGTWVIITEAFVLFEVGWCKEFVFVGEGLLIARAKVAHHFPVHTSNMPV
jgi:hypothetical protein